MSREETYTLSIVTCDPYSNYTRDISLEEQPSAAEIWNYVHRLREFAKVCGVKDVVKIGFIGLTKTVNIQSMGISVQSVNETKVL